MRKMYKLAVCSGKPDNVFLLDILGKVRMEHLDGCGQRLRRSHFSVILPDGRLQPTSIVHPPNAVFRVTDKNRHLIIQHRARGLPITGIEGTSLVGNNGSNNYAFKVRASHVSHPHIIPKPEPKP